MFKVMKWKVHVYFLSHEEEKMVNMEVFSGK
jgi:hypothetical protein